MDYAYFKERRSFVPGTGSDDPAYGTNRVLNDWAMHAYIYGYPLLLMDITRRSGLLSLAQMNRFYHQKVPATPKFTLVVRPNVDTLYSSAWLDLSRGPLLLHVPNTDNRYYVLPLLDAWSNVFASVGARTTGTGERVFVIVGPGWHGALPAGIPVIAAPTNAVWITGRTQTNGPADYAAVHAIQEQYELTRLNGFVSAGMPEWDALLHNHIILGRRSPRDVIASMDAAAFFNLMMSVMYRNPPYPAIQSHAMTAELGAMGLIPGPHFDFYKLHPTVQQALANAVRSGPQTIRTASDELFKKSETNGWSMLLKNMGFYGKDYVRRAVVAMNLFGANLPEDAVYAYSSVDSDGSPLDGSNNYVMHFNAGRLPPANAFWSVTLYNAAGFLVENPLKRYAVAPHLGKLNYNKDGSLDIYIQHASPGHEREPNWLPAPAEPFNLTLRMYWPQQPVLKGRWHSPPVEVDLYRPAQGPPVKRL